jgi:MYXO-CTERM domain-containing protein
MASHGQAAPQFTGDVDRDFAGTPAAVRINDPGQQELSFEGRVSGLDLEALTLWHDPETDTLYVGLVTYGIAGDVDGDGQPGGTSAALDRIDGVDHPAFGGGESFAVEFDFNGDGTGDVIAGVPGTGDLDAFTVAQVNGPFPPFAFGATLPGHAGGVTTPSLAAPHIEFTINRFSELPGLPGGGALGIIGARAFMGSTEDAAIGDDWAPGQDITAPVCFDTDGDGVTTCEGDCRDGDDQRHPGAIERCDRVDDDCDGVVDEDCVSQCGDGMQGGDEPCDDGNAVDGDGCDSNCTLTACGNGVRTGEEECDDGNAEDGDGCDTNCTVTGCGNGVQTGEEACDDGNITHGDGCDGNCTLTGCGNAVQTDGEDCDDGNDVVGDGCGIDCHFECGDEICNGIDDDCDGSIDEGFALGVLCETGQGACAAEGTTVCADDTRAIRCDAVAGVARAERCDGIDDDCDGAIDEDFDLGEVCSVGTGVCAEEGVRTCRADGRGGQCDASPGEPSEEICNRLDDDCDGEVDEADPPQATICEATRSVKGGGCIDCAVSPDGDHPSAPWLLGVILLGLAHRRRR